LTVETAVAAAVVVVQWIVETIALLWQQLALPMWWARVSVAPLPFTKDQLSALRPMLEEQRWIFPQQQQQQVL
jgi:hypothetical protein